MFRFSKLNHYKNIFLFISTTFYSKDNRYTYQPYHPFPTEYYILLPFYTKPQYSQICKVRNQFDTCLHLPFSIIQRCSTRKSRRKTLPKGQTIYQQPSVKVKVDRSSDKQGEILGNEYASAKCVVVAATYWPVFHAIYTTLQVQSGRSKSCISIIGLQPDRCFVVEFKTKPF